MADKRISQLVDRGTVANNDVVPIVVSGASTTNKATISSIQTFMQGNLDLGVTSVGLSMPLAFTVSNSPVTASGNIAVTGSGTVAQYIRGDGSLADFPQGGGGGGASVSYYLNGSVSQGTIGGVAYREINRTPILGTGTDFVAIADGYLASFITDAGDPGLLEIPGGNWNFETYFSASSGGGSPSFYIELYKVNSGGTATLIASNSGTPELIAFGTTITPYFSTLAVPTTALAITDRLALRYYVARSGRTITLHTENSHLCQITTTFTTGLTALNGLTAQVQNFATGTSGTDFGISSSVSTHTFNLPDASATARGVVTTGTQTFAGLKIFTGTISANNDIQLAAAGTASTTFIKNISGAGLTSIGSNGFGFNNSDNIYFSGSNKGGGIIAFSNTGNRTYTLQDASGTLAFTSQIPANPVGGTGAAGRVAYWNSSGTITSDSLFQWNDTFKRLGIGRTPTVSLDVEGAGFFSGALGVGNRITLSTNDQSTNRLTITNSGAGGRSYSIVGGLNGANNSGFSIFDETAGSTRFDIASTGAATFSSSVNLGTNANSGDTALLNIKQAGVSYNQGIYIERGGERNGYHIYIGGALDSLTFRSNYFGTQSDVMSLTRDGNLGIGTASPGARLAVKQSGSEIPMIIDSSSNSFSAYTQYKVNNSGGWETGMANASEGFKYLFCYGTFGTANSKVAITNSGNVGIGTASPSFQLQLSTDSAAKPTTALWTISSDARIKENITRYEKGLNELMQINPINYDYNGLGGFVKGKGGVGIIAQEIADILPDSVNSYPAKLNQDDEEETDILNFNGHELIYVLINSIKELKTEIDSLKNQIK